MSPLRKWTFIRDFTVTSDGPARINCDIRGTVRVTGTGTRLSGDRGIKN